ncbi:sialidase family protein [Arcanobacterium canis]
MECELVQEPHVIASPWQGVGELRIPALAVYQGTVHLLFDVRPAPVSGSGSDFIGTTLASDLPNPNWIAQMTSPCTTDAWSAPTRLDMPVPIASDSCMCATPAGLFVAYGSTTSVGYFESVSGGEQLQPWVAFGPNLHNLAHRNISLELYSETGADAVFATSGSTIEFNGQVLVPYVCRWGDRTGVLIVHFVGTDIVEVSSPIMAETALLDECTLAVVDGEVWANFRVQGFVGRGSGVRFMARSSDGVNFTPPQELRLADPGCNAKQLGDLLIHPGSSQARENGEVVRISPGHSQWDSQILTRFSSGAFGYCDAVWVGNDLVVVFEREREIWCTRMSVTN